MFIWLLAMTIIALVGIWVWYYNESSREEFVANARIISKDMHSPEAFYKDAKWFWEDGLSFASYSWLTEERYWLILKFDDGPLAGETRHKRVPKETYGSFESASPIKVLCVRKILGGTQIKKLI